MKNKILIVFSIGLLSFSTVQSQTYEEYLKQYQADFKKYKEQQEQMISRLRKEYSDYVIKRDKEYSDYLKKEWSAFQVFAGKKPPEKPKPKSVPEYKKTIAPSVSRIPVLTPQLGLEPEYPAVIKLPVIQKPEPSYFAEDAFSFEFCGAKVYVDIDHDLKNISVTKKGKAAITGFWDQASKTNYNRMINQLMEAKTRFNLNDYGYFRLVATTSENVYPLPEQEDNRLLLQWFLMVRSGYDIRMAYNAGRIALLLGSYNNLYSMKYLTLNGLNYYIVSPFDGNDILTYEMKYDQAASPVDLTISHPINFGNKPVKKMINFKYLDKEYPVEILYDPGVILFYKDYPQSDMQVYFNAAVSRETKESIEQSFRQILANMTEPEAVNFLLNFVQTAFEYKTDQEQFNREKFFFAEELFYYPACDCEDRSVLFAYLVRDLLGLKVVGLEYPEHMSTAVHFNDDEPGDYVNAGGVKYVMADPTYINAPFGRTMPDVADEQAKIITMNDFGNQWMNQNKVWDIAMKAGIKKAGYNQCLVFDKKGNAYLTGYYNGKLTLGTYSVEGLADQQNFVVAKFNADGKILWMDPVKGTNNATGLAVGLDNTGNIYVAGSFTGNFSNLRSGKGSDLFMTKYSAEGKPLWLKNAGLDTIPKGAGLIYSVGFTKTGEKNKIRIVEYNPSFADYGLYVTDSLIEFNGAIQNTMVPSETALTMNTVEEMNFPDLLKKEFDKYVSQNTDRSVAGLFAISSVIKAPGMIVSGKTVQQTFDKYNPGFKKQCPNMYKLIGKVSFMKNSNNIITLLTENGGDVLFDKIKLANNAQLRISMLPTGDAQVDAMTGVKVGKLIVWYVLNYIRVYSRTGDLLFDYDKDHTQAKMNLKKDILN